MNKRTVLKSVLAVAILGFVLVFSSCKKEEQKIIGTWKCQKVEIKELQATPEIETAVRSLFVLAQGLIKESFGTVEFTKDGKMLSTSNGVAVVSNYAVNGSKLTLTYPEDATSTTAEISFKKKEMYMDSDMNGFLGSDDENSKITKFVVRMTLEKQ